MPALNQKLIDQRLYEVAPRRLEDPVKCCVCESTNVTKLASREIVRGRMFIVGPDSRAFDASRSLAFCATCWPRWMMWRARLGYDLHWNHASDEPCHPGCVAAKGGRQAQLAAQMSLLGQRTDGFFVVKSIDGQPHVNGSPLIWSMRTFHFMFRTLKRQNYYESVGDPAEVQRQLLLGFSLHGIGVPRAQIDGIIIIVEAFESWYTAPRGVISMPRPDDTSIGLHCVHLTHYADSGAVLGFWNCWGPSWGDREHGTMSFEYLERYFHGLSSVVG